MMKVKFSGRFSMAVTSLILFLGFLGSSPLRAGEDDRACSNRTIQGDYGFSAEGSLLNNPGLPATAAFRSVGIVHFDGRGNLTWVEHTVINGIPHGFAGTPATGTYVVEADC